MLLVVNRHYCITPSDCISSSLCNIVTLQAEKVRIEMLKALCVVGVKDYHSALKMILASLDLLKDCKASHTAASGASNPLSAGGPGVEGSNREGAAPLGVSGQGSADCSTQGPAHRGPNVSLSGSDWALLLRCEWILCYHSALCLYSTGRYAKALQVHCVSILLYCYVVMCSVPSSSRVCWIIALYCIWFI